MTTILELLSRRGIKVRKASNNKGGEYVSECPGCGGEGPGRKTHPADRFRIWPEQHEGTGSYWCRKCKRGGDCVQFLRDFEGLTFHQACERLGRTVPDSRDLTLKSPALPAVGKWDPKTHASPEALWRDQASKLSFWAYEQLLDKGSGQEQLKWLQHDRGLTPKTIDDFGLGWNPGKDGKDLFRSRESWGLSTILNEETGKPRRLWLPIGHVIPWFYKGELRRLRIRRVKPVPFGPPYYMVPGSSPGIMILPAHTTSRWAGQVWAIVESELDGLLVWQEAGDLCGVMAIGSASMRPDTEAMALLRRSVHTMVALDNDAPGQKEYAWWKEHISETVWHPVPIKKDPAEAFKAGVNIREWILAGLPEGLRYRHALNREVNA